MRFWLKIHLILLLVLVLNSITKIVWNIGWIYEIEFVLDVLLILTGWSLFWCFFKQQSKWKYYFGTYVLGSVITILALIFRGVIGAIALSFILFPFYPDTLAWKKNNFRIYEPYQGMMQSCCVYTVAKTKWFCFEKRYDTYMSDGIVDLATIKLNEMEDKIEVSYKLNNDPEWKKDILMK